MLEPTGKLLAFVGTLADQVSQRTGLFSVRRHRIELGGVSSEDPGETLLLGADLVVGLRLHLIEQAFRLSFGFLDDVGGLTFRRFGHVFAGVDGCVLDRAGLSLGLVGGGGLITDLVAVTGRPDRLGAGLDWLTAACRSAERGSAAILGWILRHWVGPFRTNVVVVLTP